MSSATDRQERISWWSATALREARIAVIGAGALGNEVLKNLALMGAGNVFVFDLDAVEESNLSRAVLFDRDCLDDPKATVAAARAKEMNVDADASVRGFQLDVVHELGGGFFRRMSLVLGCLDNMEARQRVGQWCFQFGIPYIDGAMRELLGRVQLHRTGEGACMECTIGSSQRAAMRKRYSCLNIIRTAADTGALPTVQVTSAFVASLMCQEAVKYLSGVPVPFGHVLSWSGDRNELELLRLMPARHCAVCEFEPSAVRELSLGCGATVRDLLAAVGPDWTVHLPGAFVSAIRCNRCGTVTPVGKPSFRCRSHEIVCAACGERSLLVLDTVETCGPLTPAEFAARSLSEVGVPPLAVLVGERGQEVASLELSADEAVYGTFGVPRRYAAGGVGCAGP